MNQESRTVTLTTDFGTADGYTGIVKGVIKAIARNAFIIDLTNQLPPSDIEAASWILANSYRYFAPDTIHLAVVDPGVGSSRKSLVVKTEKGLFVGPDNGIFSAVLKRERDSGAEISAFAIADASYGLAEISNTFHARDLYAPVAAHLCAGKEPHEIGEPLSLTDLVYLPEPRLTVSENLIEGEVVHIDRFGNLITNIPNHLVEENLPCYFGSKQIATVVRTYSDGAKGEPISLKGSHGFLEIAVYQDSASSMLSAARHSLVSLGRAP